MDIHRHFIIHKPYGYLSQFVNNQNKRKNKRLLGELFNFPEGTMAIGRLDEDSEGLLFLTTDGKISEKIRSKKVEKEYHVQVDGIITDDAIIKLSNGVGISVNSKIYITKKGDVSKIETVNFPERTKRVRDDRHGPTSWVSITITEGKFRQVRKMTASVGFPTLRLIRVRIGSIVMKEYVSGNILETDSDFKAI